MERPVRPNSKVLIDNRTWQVRHDTGKNDHGHTITNTAGRNLLTQPNQEHGPTMVTTTEKRKKSPGSTTAEPL